MIIALLGIVFLVIFIASNYNSLVRLRNNSKKAFSTIDVMLKKRHDLIPNLVASVKEYMVHERGLLEKITALRAQAISGASGDKMATEAQLTSMLGQLNVAMENYPTLKADHNISKLQASLNEIEEQIAASRSAYNAAVNRLNNKIETFPSNIIANSFGFQQGTLFEASAQERENVNVSDLFKK